MARFKGPEPKANPFGGKSVAQPAPVDPNKLPPIFSFEYMADGGGYSVNCCDRDHRAALAARLFLLSRVTWMQIQQSQRHGIGSEKIARNNIKPPIPAKVTEDASLLALRYNGLCPMVGFRDGRTFNVLFIDHSMDVYPHE